MKDDAIEAEFRALLLKWKRWKQSRTIYAVCLVGLVLDYEQDFLISRRIVLA